MTDNPAQQGQQAPEGTQQASAPAAQAAPEVQPSSSGWKSSLSSDLASSPLAQKFDDSPEGLNEAFKSHANLEQLLGHEKVPIPKGPEDAEGWNRFSKAMGIPDKAEAYGLPDPSLPESMKGMTLNKEQFAEIAHAHKLTPAQAKGLWETYQATGVDAYSKAMEAHQQKLTESINMLKGEWGDAYDSNVQLGQQVINKFSADQEMNDYITSVLSTDPKGIKFLAKIGEQFAENKIGEFQMSRFSLAPEQAQEEIDKLVNDLEGPYMNQSGKFTDREHQAAIDRVNALRVSINRARG